MLKEINARSGVAVSLSTDVNMMQNNIKPIVCSTIRGTRDNPEKHLTR